MRHALLIALALLALTAGPVRAEEDDVHRASLAVAACLVDKGFPARDRTYPGVNGGAILVHAETFGDENFDWHGPRNGTEEIIFLERMEPRYIMAKGNAEAIIASAADRPDVDPLVIKHATITDRQTGRPSLRGEDYAYLQPLTDAAHGCFLDVMESH